MIDTMRGHTRPQSPGEEIANSISHGFGLLAAGCVIPVLIANAARRGGAAGIVGVGIFAAAIVLLYLISTVYHALPQGRAKQLFQVLDHSAIFLLIAGTYMPFTFGVLRGVWGWTLFGLVWGVAAAGVLLKTVGGLGHPILSTGLYLGMGWLILIAIRPLWLRLPPEGLVWLAAGGIAYTAGVGFFAATRIRYSHFVWHLFVMTGTACHVIAVLWYAA